MIQSYLSTSAVISGSTPYPLANYIFQISDLRVETMPMNYFLIDFCMPYLIKNPNASGFCDPFSGVYAAFQENDLLDTRTSGSYSNLPNVATFVGLSDDGVSH
jgi:hypothetical protein